MASEIPVQSNNEVICNDVQITTGVEEVGVADHASNANISPNGFHLVALLSVQLRVLNDSIMFGRGSSDQWMACSATAEALMASSMIFFGARDCGRPRRTEKDRLSAPEKLFWSFSDRFSAGVLSQCGSWVAKYHEHDSLLKNIVKETLTDEERKQLEWSMKKQTE
uniref:Uncharacterized protein n=1 Tax=Trichuris muris TaxID=70415 RepID=A0A5S6Q2P0_TRIMR